MPEIETVSGSELLIMGGGSSPCGWKPHEDIEVILLEVSEMTPPLLLSAMEFGVPCLFEYTHPVILTSLDL